MSSDSDVVDVRRQRIKALALFFNTTYALVNNMELGDKCQAELVQVTCNSGNAEFINERTLCTHGNHGELIRHLKRLGYWPPIRQAQDIQLSANEVSCLSPGFQKLNKIQQVFGQLSAIRTVRPRPHDKCDMGKVLMAQLKEVKGRFGFPGEGSCEVMQEKAQSSGLDTEARSEGFPIVVEATEAMVGGVRQA